MSGGPTSRDPGVYSRPGAASVRQAALWDAIYELAIGNVTGITPEGAQALIDQSLLVHENKPDPHEVYVTVPEGDLRWGASSGLSPHTHEEEASGGVIDYLRTAWGTGHLAAADPHGQYQTAPEVQAAVDAALTALKAEPDPFTQYVNVAGDTLLGTLVTRQVTPDGNYTRDLGAAALRWNNTYGYRLFLDGNTNINPSSAASNAVQVWVGNDSQYRYLVRADGRTQWGPGNAVPDTTLERTGAGALTLTGALSLSGLLTSQGSARFQRAGLPTQALIYFGSTNSQYLQWDGAKYQLVGGNLEVTGHYTVPTTNTYDLGTSAVRLRKAWGVDADLSGSLVVATALTVAAKAVALSPNAGQTLQWLANGFYSDSPTKATVDALTARVATLEAQVATLNAQMGAGANGHYHLMGTWRQTAKATLPATVLEEAPAA